MPESKAKLKARLERTGQWDAFVAVRESLKDAQGMPAQEAWHEAAKQFPPGSENAAKGQAISSWEMNYKASDFTNNSTDAREILQWVLDAIGRDDVTPGDAPSPGAFFYYMELRASPELRAEFFRTIYPKLLPSKSQLEALAEQFADDGRGLIAVLDKVAAAAERAKAAHNGEAA